MSTHKTIRSKRRRAVQLAGLDEQPKPNYARPSAHDAIFAWLLWLPSEADPRKEALLELDRLAARGELPEQAKELQNFLIEIASSEAPPIR